MDSQVLTRQELFEQYVAFHLAHAFAIHGTVPTPRSNEYSVSRDVDGQYRLQYEATPRIIASTLSPAQQKSLGITTSNPVVDIATYIALPPELAGIAAKYAGKYKPTSPSMVRVPYFVNFGRERVGRIRSPETSESLLQNVSTATVEDVADILVATPGNRMAIYTGAGISRAGRRPVWDLKEMFHNIGLDLPEAQFLGRLATNPFGALKQIASFDESALYPESTGAHDAIARLMRLYPSTSQPYIMTENFDGKHEWSGVPALHVLDIEFQSQVEDLIPQIDVLLVIGVKEDNRGIIQEICKRNPTLRLISTALEPSHRDFSWQHLVTFIKENASNESILWGDCQTTIPVLVDAVQKRWARAQTPDPGHTETVALKSGRGESPLISTEDATQAPSVRPVTLASRADLDFYSCVEATFSTMTTSEKLQLLAYISASRATSFKLQTPKRLVAETRAAYRIVNTALRADNELDVQQAAIVALAASEGFLHPEQWAEEQSCYGSLGALRTAILDSSEAAFLAKVLVLEQLGKYPAPGHFKVFQDSVNGLYDDVIHQGEVLRYYDKTVDAYHLGLIQLATDLKSGDRTKVLIAAQMLLQASAMSLPLPSLDITPTLMSLLTSEDGPTHAAAIELLSIFGDQRAADLIGEYVQLYERAISNMASQNLQESDEYPYHNFIECFRRLSEIQLAVKNREFPPKSTQSRR